MKKNIKKTQDLTSIYDSALSTVDLNNSLTLKFSNIKQDHFEIEFEFFKEFPKKTQLENVNLSNFRQFPKIAKKEIMTGLASKCLAFSHLPYLFTDVDYFGPVLGKHRNRTRSLSRQKEDIWIFTCLIFRAK